MKPLSCGPVVEVDGSEPSRRPLRWPALIAQSLHASMAALICCSAERELRAAAALGDGASHTMMAYRPSRQRRYLRGLVEVGVDRNTAVVLPAPLMTTLAELGSFLGPRMRAAKPTAIAQSEMEPTAARPVNPDVTTTAVAAEPLSGRS